ncbi:glycerophosphodiester phosphodiesterase family protein [Patulibacter americanus]|uniref:glycerophosphodiester phosphodiesterase family protein n=1 Tax=Patulibacter americanus TaxID=588672 RepID=UPI0003B72898|nr:glycerophosphodiester phosphodiesterase family protein [Patulibacter americanus]
MSFPRIAPPASLRTTLAAAALLAVPVALPGAAHAATPAPTAAAHTADPSNVDPSVPAGATAQSAATPTAARRADTPAGSPVVSETFDDGKVPDGWTPGAGSGTWDVENGRLIGRSANSGQVSTIAFGPHLEDYRFEATVRFESVVDGNRWLALALDMPATGVAPWGQAAMRSNTTATNGTEFAQRTPTNQWSVTNTAAAPTAAGVGTDVKVAIEVHGTSATWFFNGAKVQTTNTLFRSEDGGLGLVANGAKVQFDDITVTPLAAPSLVLPNDATAVPKVVAHRGYSSVSPENTNAAMAIGSRAGADFVEDDVATNADGEPWIIHDDTVDRTTDGTGALATLTSSYLQGLDAGSWFGSAFEKEPLPSLDSQLDVVKGGTAKLLLEIKSPETEAEVRNIIDHVRAKGMVRRTVIQSFDDNIVRWAKAYEPNIPTMILRGGLDADPVATAKELGVVSYNPSAAALRGKPEVVQALNDAGIAVMPYTVDSPADWLTLRDLGVDGIITNRAGELVGWNLRYAQGGAAAPAKPATAAILAPKDGAELTRGEQVSLALDAEGDTSIEATLDGKPIAPGDTIDPDALALGEHVLRVSAPGAAGQPATAESRFTVRATSTGVASLVATLRGIPTDLRAALLPLAVERRWAAFRARLTKAEASLTADVFALLDGDAAALQVAEGAGEGETPAPSTPEKGDKGDKGDPGTNGKDGAQGPKGNTGARGPAGPKGKTGAKGPKGDRVTVVRNSGLRCSVSTRTISCTKTKTSSRTTARLTRSGRVYAKGPLRRLVRTRTITQGRYTLRIGTGAKAAKVAVRFG